MRQLFPLVSGFLLLCMYWGVAYKYTRQKHVKFATVRLFDNSLQTAGNSSKDDSVLYSDATEGIV